jgi:hypothetical protein
MLEMKFLEYIRPLPGKKSTYHLGMLCEDRQDLDASGRAAEKAGLAAWQDYKDGRVTLVQKKVSTGVYSYIAIGLER